MTQSALKHRYGLIFWLLFSQLLALASLALWFVMAMMSLMAFDAGQNWQNSLFVLTVWAYPLLPIGFTIAAWVAFAKQKNGTAALLSALTFVPIVLFYLLLQLL